MEGYPIKQSTLKIIIVISLAIIVSILFVNFKGKLDKLHTQNLLLTQEIYTFESNWNKHMDEIRKSIIFLRYNNDNLISTIKHNNQSFRQITDKNKSIIKSYPKTSHQMILFFEEYKDAEKLTYKFMKTNARIKNSLLNLKRRLKNINEFDKIYQKNLIDIFSNFMHIKSNFNQKMNLAENDYLFFKHYAKNNETLYHLTFAHIKLLYQEIPQLKALYSELENSPFEDIQKTMLDDLFIESSAHETQIRTYYYFLIFIFFMGLLFILYSIRKTELYHQNMINLQKDKDSKLLLNRLTQLPNRNAFVLDRKKSNGCFLLINIIEFKKVNSTIGQTGGDYILQQMANLLQQEFEKVYHLGIDNFGLYFDTTDIMKVKTEALKVLSIIETFDFNYKGLSIPIAVDMGISNQHDYQKSAELAIHQNKTSFTRISIYDNSMDDKDKSTNNFSMLSKVKKALKKNNIRPFFQPIVDIKTKKIVKYEALVRLIDGEKIIPPFFFLDICKTSKLYPQITKLVINKSIKFIQENKIDVSINLSYQDIIDDSTKNYIILTLKNYKEISSYISFEILESDEIQDYQKIYAFIETVKQYGAKIAIDDFGSGYSNFTQLFNMKPDIVKIDGSLIREIHTNNNSRNIVEAIVTLASKSNIQTVAEFIDNEEVHEIVKELGITYGQGYLYSEPKDLLKPKVSQLNIP